MERSACQSHACPAGGSGTERDRAAGRRGCAELKDRLTLEVARSIREDYLHQNAFDEVDTYTSLAKQFAMLRLILEYQEKGNQALDAGANLSDVIALPVREQIGRAKYIPESEMKRFEQIESDLSSQCAALMDEGGEG